MSANSTYLKKACTGEFKVRITPASPIELQKAETDHITGSEEQHHRAE